MKEAGEVIGAVALLLLAVAWIVFGLGDGTLFVPSPAVTAQSFLRSLAVERYEIAASYLGADLEEHVSPDTLRHLWEPLLERGGEILNVSGEWEEIGKDTASAMVAVKTADAGVRNVTLALQREHGVWKVAELDGVQNAVDSMLADTVSWAR